MLRTPPPASTIPELETQRLRLRAHTPADFERYSAMWSEPDVVRYTTLKPLTPEESWTRLIRHAGDWAMLGFGSWLVEEKSTGELVGEVGLFDRRRDIEPAITVPEIGWILTTGMHGKGYATEAVQAILDWARDRFVSDEIACLIHPDNTASLRLAARFGFVLSHTTTFRDQPAMILKRQSA
jgi:RimJ/RimL family protein N-acetyltransferase